MKLLFRVDSGWHIGNGHVMRCLSLARVLVEKGYEISFFCKDHENNIYSEIEKEFKLTLFQDGARKLKDEVLFEKDWIGSCIKSELAFLNQLISDDNIDVIIFDHYSIDKEYEEQVDCRYRIVIDDRMNGAHLADILIDYNISAKRSSYEQLVDKSCNILVGSEYTIVEEKFAIASREYSPGGTLENILVNFGGADFGNDCLKIAKAIEKIDIRHRITFLLPETHGTFLELKTIAGKRENVSLVSYTNEMDEFLLGFDLCIGASGTSVLERFMLGIPSLLVTISDSQKLVMDALSAKSFVNFLGRNDDLSENDWICIFEELDDNYPKYKRDALEAKRYFDGRGIYRLVNKIDELIKEERY